VSLILSVEDLTVDVGPRERGTRALDAVSFTLAPGESLALIGESGCGKTLAARAVLRLLPPGARIAGGKISFRGLDLRLLPEEAMSGIRGGVVGYVFQEPAAALDPVMTAGRQVAEAVRFHRPMSARAARARAEELLKEVGLPDPRRIFGEYPHRLSGGMLQRVMVAIALAGDPLALFADEPTASLDAVAREQILDLLDRLRRERSLGLLLVTHDLSLAAARCDRVCVLYAGRVVEEGPSAPFFAAPLHPYSRALLACVPQLPVPGRAAPARFPAIRGQVPPPGARPEGECLFAPRCPEVFDECRRAEPPIYPLSQPGGLAGVRCFLYRPVSGRPA
jgi:oligopeptide/dipeptide ABC transporter ATP-binding protein